MERSGATYPLDPRHNSQLDYGFDCGTGQHDRMPSPVESRTLTLSADGVDLVADAYGDEQGAPVVLLHGGGQTRHAWGGAAEAFAAAGRYALAVDLRGHGHSDWSPDGMYGLSRFAGDVHTIVEYLGRPPALVGASLGGLSSIIAVGESSDSVASSLVLVDVAPRVEEEGRNKIADFMRAGFDGFDTLDDAADLIASFMPHRERPTDLSARFEGACRDTLFQRSQPFVEVCRRRRTILKRRRPGPIDRQ